MSIDLEKAPFPDDRSSAPSDSGTPSLDALRRHLRLEMDRLRARHRAGIGGGEIAGARSDVADLAVGHACQVAAAEIAPILLAQRLPVAVVAVGGHGRRELAPCSDVDLLFVHAGEAVPELGAVSARAVSLLSELGFSVRYRFRSVSECLERARGDLHARTSLLEGRLVTGSEELFRRLAARLPDGASRRSREAEAFLDALRTDLAARYAQYSRAVCLQEPHVKEGAGGLRDLHVVSWIGHALYASRDLRALHEIGRIRDDEYAGARRAHDFLLRVRNEAHFATGRRTDILDLDLQPTLALSLGYRDKKGRLASELFMTEYYQRAATVHRFSRAFVLRHAPARPPRFSLRLFRRRNIGAFTVREGRLHARARPLPDKPLRLLEAFAVAQAEALELSDELKLEAQDALDLVDRRFRASPAAGRLFLALFSRKGRVGAALRAMHETGILGRLLPEFARITFLVQHDYHHRHTTDEHALRAVEALDALAAEDDLARVRLREVLDEVESPAALYLGVLLHEIGAGARAGAKRGAQAALRLCTRLGTSPRMAEDVAFLVSAHAEMSQISERRDLGERELIAEFSRRVGTLDRLNMLLLLTYAARIAGAPDGWNQWRASLLWDLYQRARHELTAVRPGPWTDGRMTVGWWKARRRLALEAAPSEVERHFALMPAKYLRAYDGPEMVRHFRMLQSLSARALAAEWRTPHGEQFTELTVAARNRPGLFAALAGTLTAQAIDILSVDLYTREDGLAVDVFQVREVAGHGPVPASRRPLVEESLEAAVLGHLDVLAAVAAVRSSAASRGRTGPAPTIRFFSDSGARTVVEVRAGDEPGLAFDIARTLSACGLDIDLAKISTEKGQALDVFYVAGPGGARLSAGDLARVRDALVACLTDAGAAR